jgi:hypothetical protein
MKSKMETLSVMRARTITVTLTVKQAECLLLAASQTLGHQDAGDATFPNRRDWNAAAIAHDKIQAALHP